MQCSYTRAYSSRLDALGSRQETSFLYSWYLQGADGVTGGRPTKLGHCAESLHLFCELVNEAFMLRFQVVQTSAKSRWENR